MHPSTPPSFTLPTGKKRCRNASPDVSARRDEDSCGEAEEAIPFLTTLSTNTSNLFYGCTNVQRGFAEAFARSQTVVPPGADEENREEESGSLHSTHGDDMNRRASGTLQEKQASVVGVAPQSATNAEDATYLHRMLEDIMDAAAQFATASMSSSSHSAQCGVTLPACAYLLRTYFHFASGAFKPQQQEVCFSILSGQSTLAVCPTGWGKSLCYQFPMLVWRLMFECRYEQWCRQAGVTSALTRTDYSDKSGTSEQQADPWDPQNGTGAGVALPSTLYSRFCVVVSPLLALMEDQAEKINCVAHLNAFVLSSKVNAAREAQLFQELESPLCPLDIIFVSPEKFIASVRLRRVLQSQVHRLAMLCVDEVHCVSCWAYDFRPTFMYVSRVLDDPLLEDAAAASSSSASPSRSSGKYLAATRRSSGSCVPYLCLTATATSAVTRDVQRRFRIERTILCADQRRENLELQSVDLVARHAVFHNLPSRVADGVREEVAEPSSRVVQDALLEAVRELPKPMLIYVQSRADADELSGLLSAKVARGEQQPLSAESRSSNGENSCSSACASVSASRAEKSSKRAGGGLFHAAHYARQDEGEGVSVEGVSGPTHSRLAVPVARELVVRCYHAALTRSVRTATQRQFLEGKIDVLVATVAFGMGIDKADIRSVVHASAPSSLEGYVQETGRAGRDGERSVCRILYNPFDFYTLRSRLWTSLLSPAEMHSIVKAILSGPTTRVGKRLMLVSTSALSSELGFSEDAIETVLFLLLTETGDTDTPVLPNTIGLAGGTKGQGSALKLHAPFRAVLGSYALKYRVLSVQGDAERRADPAITASASAASPFAYAPDANHAAKRRRTSSSTSTAASAGVGFLLRQLGASDAVLELCRVMPTMANQIELANRLSMPFVEFQQRMQDLIEDGMIRIARYGIPSALLIELSDCFADAASPSGQEALAEHLLSLHRGRLDAQVSGLREMFRVLVHPTHDAIVGALRCETLDARRVNCVSSAPLWSPPRRGCGKMQAVSIANAFVEENRLRIHSAYEALRALLGIRPKSLIQHGKYAGQLPLSQSWYVNSPYFGALRHFDLAWVLQILAPHDLDAALPDH
ncbi:ATP-dependent DEAD/H DNA helicase recQ family- like protein [Leptomonas seymouri]|uniref:DNA 3'-5' helicase n=1 Tax=Leptomonas seymouri TaxID=5684 RepID=A0A0N1IMF3_LEPSE|nr:ATP-dependent DEAD/H DNA helicase recQ family- like protein [Leptomonas seymouri]|eukprot:KPI90195.1 ATP-dependent DEAD/H DNA helicase recQ family- like protein [Leptomonas seymouri]